MAEVIKATGTILSATTGTQYVPFDTEVFNNDASQYVLSGTSAVGLLVSGGPFEVHANVKINISTDAGASREWKLELRQTTSANEARGYNEIDNFKLTHQGGENIFNRNRTSTDEISQLTLGGSTVVSADALDRIGLYLTGPVANTTVSASMTVKGLN